MDAAAAADRLTHSGTVLSRYEAMAQQVKPGMWGDPHMLQDEITILRGIGREHPRLNSEVVGLVERYQALIKLVRQGPPKPSPSK